MFLNGSLARSSAGPSTGIVASVVLMLVLALAGCAPEPEHVEAPIASTSFSTLADNPTPPSSNRFDPGDAVGWHHATLLANLGEADYVLQDGENLLLQYDTRNCIIEFDVLPVRGRMKVTAWRIRGRSAGAVVHQAACERQLGERINQRR